VLCCAVSHLDTLDARALAGCLPCPPLAASLTRLPADSHTLRALGNLGHLYGCVDVDRVQHVLLGFGGESTVTYPSRPSRYNGRVDCLTGVWSLMSRAGVSVAVCIPTLACKEMVGLASLRRLGAGRQSGSCWVFSFCAKVKWWDVWSGVNQQVQFQCAVWAES
jgi:hypothetical protein